MNASCPASSDGPISTIVTSRAPSPFSHVADSQATTPPPTIRVAVAEGRFVQAQLVSAAPRADSRVQGPTAFYRASAASGLMPGLNVTVFVPQGHTAQ